MKLANVTNQITTERIAEVKAAMEKKEMSKGAAIRELFAGGYEVKQISEALGIRYNHCYNVIQNEVLVHGLEVEKTGRNGSGKKEEVLKLLSEGKTLQEISKELGMIYNSVWQIAKAAGLTQKQKAEQSTESKTKKSKKVEVA